MIRSNRRSNSLVTPTNLKGPERANTFDRSTTSIPHTVWAILRVSTTCESKALRGNRMYTGKIAFELSAVESLK